MKIDLELFVSIRTPITDIEKADLIAWLEHDRRINKTKMSAGCFDGEHNNCQYAWAHGSCHCRCHNPLVIDDNLDNEPVNPVYKLSRNTK